MTRSFRSAALAGLLAVLAPLMSVQAGAAPLGPAVQTLEETRASARALLVGRLLALAKWSNDNELFEERDRVWKIVIGIDIDNLEARKGLRYARNTDGSWKEPSPRAAKNRNPAALEELPAKRTEAIGPFRDALLGHLKGHPDADPTLRRGVLEEILSIDPDDAEVHGLLGETQVDGIWVLSETATAKTRRAALRAAVQAAKDSAPPVGPTTPSPQDAALFEGWKSGSQCGSVRVLGTEDAAQCDELARKCAIAGAVLEPALGATATFSEGFTLYVLSGPADKETFLSHLPAGDDVQRESLKRTTGGGVPGTWNVVLFEKDPAKRLDSGVRHALAHLFLRGWKLEPKNAWIFEGLGLYLTREICGTRLTWFCSGAGVSSEGKNSPRGKLMVADSNWMNEALKVLTREAPLDLEAVLERELSGMGVEDLVVSYALCAYLVEGRPEATPIVLEAIGKGAEPADALKQALGLPVTEIEERLVRWLKERK